MLENARKTPSHKMARVRMLSVYSLLVKRHAAGSVYKIPSLSLALLLANQSSIAMIWLFISKPRTIPSKLATNLENWAKP